MNDPIRVRLQLDMAPAQRSVALLERAPEGVRDVIAKCLADLLHDGIEIRLAEGLSAPAADGSYVQTVEVSLPRLDERLAALGAGDADAGGVRGHGGSVREG